MDLWDLCDECHRMQMRGIISSSYKIINYDEEKKSIVIRFICNECVTKKQAEKNDV
jgi:hypothetical protein